MQLRGPSDGAKRAFDIVSASVGLTLLTPLLCLIAVGVRLDSPGPVFYRGLRSGLGGVPFRIFKFRTMIASAERVGGRSTGKDDPRVTRFGRPLRRRKLDELPQLINVLKGEMSIVGPRPEIPSYTEQYVGEDRAILSVRPGITDLASMKFYQLAEELGSEDPDRVYEERVRPVKNALRLKYVRERSFIGDLRIVVSTVILFTFGVREARNARR